MKYAIVESGGKQYRAVEGGTLEVDRLPVNAGESIKLEQVLLLADGENIMVGTPVIKGNPVWTKVVEHFKGEKVTIFNYSPKKRIRVKTGHRQNYTRLLVEQIGGSALMTSSPQGKKEPAKVEKAVEAEAETVAPKAKAAKVEPKAETSSPKGQKPTTAVAPKAKAATAKAKTTSSPKEKKPVAKTPAKGKTTSSPKGKKPTASVSKKTTVTKAEPKKTTTKAAPTSSPKGKKPAAK
jgi:large subunit ribosomal protein L21